MLSRYIRAGALVVDDDRIFEILRAFSGTNIGQSRRCDLDNVCDMVQGAIVNKNPSRQRHLSGHTVNPSKLRFGSFKKDEIRNMFEAREARQQESRRQLRFCTEELGQAYDFDRCETARHETLHNVRPALSVHFLR